MSPPIYCPADARFHVVLDESQLLKALRVFTPAGDTHVSSVSHGSDFPK